jgi:hypothetical protein
VLCYRRGSELSVSGVVPVQTGSCFTFSGDEIKHGLYVEFIYDILLTVVYVYVCDTFRLPPVLDKIFMSMIYGTLVLWCYKYYVPETFGLMCSLCLISSRHNQYIRQWIKTPFM